ncbi:MarR family winged helix-turn-helix transcriptional regulator [Flaviaesturariibacter aridisoli]|uniref:MarR family transcriptional regulator n=1 Tax=Flaviaesturariibacter aridisoli TaxID=2545761 RepID=A0A4V6P629_9BACT|nr:MarR family transcriptional regulator [Flaviaesturariibacter aridisoli]TCZ63405.1 MarR family transcriptional regulator [Flaviaesturariibacter aridisoli]
MGLEQDIRQTKFVSAKQKAMINLLYTYGWVMEQIKTFLACEDITHQQYNILRILRGAAAPLSTLQIRARMLDKMSDTSRIVDRLVAKELVQKVTCAKDKRLVDVTISDKGLALLARLDKGDDHIQAIMKSLSENEAAQLSTLLDKIRG